MSTIETIQTPSFRKRLLNRIRYFNREYFNPFAMSFAGRPHSFWSAIQHTGRKSGKEYTTPIVAVRQEECFIIPLPYGQHADWFRNVMAAGGCTLIYHRKVYSASEPKIIPFEEGLGAYSGLTQFLLRRSETEAFLRLNKIDLDPDGEARYNAFIAAHPIDRGLWTLATIGFLAIGIGRLLRWRKS